MAVRPFIGDLETCFRHLVAKYPRELIEPMLAAFCGVVEPTVHSWVRGERLPGGLSELKLKVFLYFLGYRVSELDDLPRPLRELSQVIALGLVSLDAVANALEYKANQQLLLLLRGKVSPSHAKQLRLNQLLSTYFDSPEFKRQKSSWIAQIEDALDLDLSGQPTRLTQQPEVPAVAVVTSKVNEPLVISHLVEALSALLENGNQTGEEMPAPLSEQRVIAILDAVDRPTLRRLRTQLALLGS